MCGDIAPQVVSVDLLNVGSGTEDGASQRGALVGCGVEVVEYHLLYLLIYFLEERREEGRWRVGGEGIG